MVSVIRSILPVPQLLLAFALLAIALLSTGCGLKGDLYLPEAQSEAQNSSEANPDSDDEDNDAESS